MDWTGVWITASVPSGAVIVAAIINTRGQRVTHDKLDVGVGKVEALHEEVATGNALTSGQLNVITRGRQIDADVPAEEQTSDEKHYVEQYLEGRRHPQD